MRTDRRIIGIGLVVLLVTSVLWIPMGMADTSSRSPGADVVVEKVLKWAPNYPKIGENVTLNATLDNVGDVNATNVTIIVQATNDSLAQPIDIGTFHLGSDWGEENITSDGTNNPVYFFFYWNTSHSGLEVVEGLVYTVTVTANNATDDNATNGTASVEFDFKPPDIEDPFVESITATPSEVIVGENVTINTSLRNDGALPVQNGAILFYMDYNWSGANTDIFNTTVDLEQFNFSATFVEFEWNSTGASIGNHSVTCIIPSNEANLTSENITVVPVPPPPGKPDLAILDGSLNETSVLQGEAVNLTVTVKNVGDETSVASKLNVTDLLGFYTAEVNIPVLDPDAEDVYSIIIDTGQLAVGMHTFQVWVDKPSLNEEWNETNNTMMVTLRVNSKPDLTVSPPEFFLGAPVTPIMKALQGEEVTVLVTVRNIGLNSSLNGTKVELLLGNASDPFATKTLLPYAPGALFNVTFDWNTSAVPVGKQVIVVKVDPDDINDELDESNNMAQANFTIEEVPKPPDVTVRSVQLSKRTISAGDRVHINLTVANIGEGVAENIELSAVMENAQGAVVTILNETVVPYLAGGAMQPLGLTWDFSESLSVGNYFVRVSIDPADKIEETDETNNDNVTSIKVVEKVVPYTDILITDIAMKPKKPEKDQKVTITVTLSNRGTKDARDLTVTLFIDDKKEYEGTVTLLGKDNGTATVVFEHKFNEGGAHAVRASVFEGGISQYSMTEDVSVEKEDAGGIGSDTILLILVILLVIAIVVTLLAGGRKKPVDEDIEDEEEGLTEEELAEEE